MKNKHQKYVWLLCSKIKCALEHIDEKIILKYVDNTNQSDIITTSRQQTQETKIMGNRAVVKFSSEKKKCVYLHWNGGRDSVEPFLAFARKHQYHVRFAGMTKTEILHQVAKLIIDTSAYLVDYVHADKDNGDNGVYFVSDDWKITKRMYRPSQEQNEHCFDAFMAELEEKFAKIND